MAQLYPFPWGVRVSEAARPRDYFARTSERVWPNLLSVVSRMLDEHARLHTRLPPPPPPLPSSYICGFIILESDILETLCKRELQSAAVAEFLHACEKGVRLYMHVCEMRDEANQSTNQVLPTEYIRNGTRVVYL